MPVWLRVVRQLDRALTRTTGTLRWILSRLMCIATSAERRQEITVSLYGPQPQYLPGGDSFERGLFYWEDEFLDRAEVSHGARILVGAVGGGREALFLAQMGYDVVAFEPSDLVEGALAAVRDLPHVTILRASYGDLIDALQRSQGPLGEFTSEPFDAVILGWGSLSNLISRPTPVELLTAIRNREHRTPVLSSFITPSEVREAPVRPWSLRRFTDPFVEPGLEFTSAVGFYRSFGRSDIESLAMTTGYTPAKFVDEFGGYGHAILLPDGHEEPGAELEMG